MKHAWLLVGAVAAGISAVYLLDEKRGPKRRKMLKKRADHVLKETTHRLKDYSHDLKPYWEKYSKEFASGAQAFAEKGVHGIEETTRNGWAPSAKLLGATASAIAFYGAGRKGVVGTMLRLASLGLFTRALLASR